MRGAVTSTAVTVGTLLPVLLLVALQPYVVQERPGLQGVLSAAIAVHYLTVGTLSRPMGHVVDRVGYVRPALAGVLLASVAAVVLSWPTGGTALLVGGCMVAGVAVASGHTSSAAWVVHSVDPGRHGIAMGARQAAVPVAALIGGVVAPVGALVLGTDRVFLVLLAPLLAIAVVVASVRVDRAGLVAQRAAAFVADARGRGGRLPLLSAASACGAAGANAALILVPVSAVDRGLGPADGALALAVGGALSAVGRVTSGMWIDRRGADPARTAGVLMLLGAAVLVLSAFTTTSAWFLATTAVALLGTGSWQGLIVLGAVQRRLHRPGAASGAIASSAQLATGVTLLGLSVVTTRWSALEAFWVPVVLLVLAALMVLRTTATRAGE